MQRPNLTEKCGFCSHSFGEHYETYDGRKTACSYYYDHQCDNYACECKGFAVIQRYNTPPAQQNNSLEDYR